VHRIGHKLKPKVSLVLLTAILVFFISLQCYFTFKNYEQEKELLAKSLDESLQHAVIAYKTFSHNKERIEKLLPEVYLYSDTTYAERRSANLIWNPDFETELVMYSNCSKLPLGLANIIPNSNGWYWITSDPGEHFPQWQGKGWGGKGNFMLVDGSLLNDNVIWNQQVKTEPHRNYCFRFRISSVALSKNAGKNEYWQQALVKVKINGQYVGVSLAPSTIKAWQVFQTNWNSGNDSLANIELSDLNTGSNYNDMGLDHLEFFETGDTPIETKKRAESIKINPAIDLSAVKTLFKDEMDLRELDLSYKLVSQHIEGNTRPGKKVAQFPVPDKRLATNLYFIDTNTAVRCEVFSFTGYLLSRIAIQLVLLVVSVSFSVFLVLLIRKYLVKQEQINTLKYEITNNITHELKTPVSTILAAIDVLQQYKLLDNKEKTEQYIEITRVQAVKLNLLIDKAMEIARLESTDFNLLPEKTDLKTLIQELISSERFRLTDKLRIDFTSSGENFEAGVDTFHLSNVLNTLLENSIQYCDTDPVIHVELAAEKNKCRISIRDNGIGIPKHYQRSVFEKYFRIPDSDRHNQKGHGLGLNYVSTIMRLHKGIVTLESDGKNGTLITLVLNK
jgi:signal transduction histidine kinase